MKVRVRYFAVLREQAGTDAEDWTTEAQSVQGFYRDVRAARGFSLPPRAIRIAVNDRIVPSDYVLADGDTVVFLPPVAGG